MAHWLDAGPATPISPGERRRLETSRGPVLVAPLVGGWSAVDDRCTHAGCPFSTDGEVVAGVVICGCHGAEFDLRDGAVLRGPAERALATYPTRVAGDRLEVAIAEEGPP